MNLILNSLRLRIKALFFPGFDFSLRERLRLAKLYLEVGPIKVLDAGCGNGAFCFLMFSLGNSVIGVDSHPDRIKRCLEYRNYKRIDALRLRFAVFDLHNLLALNETFDEIICFETLEHIREDRQILKIFANLLNPGGSLHLGAPNLNCPVYYGEKISPTEDGAHIRKGYTYAMIEEMLNSLGLEVVKKDKYGGFFTRKIVALSRRLQDLSGFLKFPNFIKEVISALFFLVFNPFTYLDGLFKTEPMSIYVVAKKPL